MSGARTTFGARLRDARERAGITLESIADETKINQSLLGALERNDVSQWPKGIFRRAFLREYATAIGLPSEEVLVEFLRLFPEDKQQADPYLAQHSGELRLTLAVEPGSRAVFIATRPLAAILDLCLVFLAGAIVATIGSESVWTASGLVALVYYPLTVACLRGQTLFSHWMCGDVRGGLARRRHQDFHASARHQLRIVFRRPDRSQIPHPENASTDAAAQNTRTEAR